MIDPSGHQRDWIDWLQALLTPWIAIAVTGIAFAQWRTATNRFRLDLFDRRWAVYRAARDALGEAIRNPDMSDEAGYKYLTDISGARWLFDRHVHKYLNEELLNGFIELREAAHSHSARQGF